MTLSHPIESDFLLNKAKCNFLIDLRRVDVISRYTGKPQKRQSGRQSFSILSLRVENYRDELIEHKIIFLNAELKFTQIHSSRNYRGVHDAEFLSDFFRGKQKEEFYISL